MAGTYTRQHVTKVARKAILRDDVLVIADTNVWFDYFDPAPGAAHDTDYEGERSYLDAMIKSGKPRPRATDSPTIRRIRNTLWVAAPPGGAEPASRRDG